MRRVPTPRPWMTELRTQKQMSVTALAIAVDVTDIYIRFIERGDRSPSPALALRIGGALGLSEAETLKRFFGTQD